MPYTIDQILQRDAFSHPVDFQKRGRVAGGQTNRLDIL